MFCCDRHLVHEHAVCQFVHSLPLLFFLLLLLLFFLFLLPCLLLLKPPPTSCGLWFPILFCIPSGLAAICNFLIPVIFRFSSSSSVLLFCSLIFLIPSILCLLTGNILVTKLPVYCHMFKEEQRDIAKEW